jgi:uncharacterized phage-associated protein
LASVIDVATYILDRQGPMTTTKLQKLCYYAQGWSLAWDGEPLFDEPLQAWANGPVTPALFQRQKGNFRVSAKQIGGESSLLTASQKETVDAVLEAYGDLTGQQLGDLSHKERPWREARGNTPLGARCETELDLDVMQDYFGALDAAQG